MNAYKQGLLGLTLALLSAGAMAATCSGTLNQSMINDDLNIPANASCVINGGMVNGDIKVGNNASLSIKGTSIQGDIDSKNAKSINISKATVHGDVELEHTKSALSIAQSVINGDLKCTGTLSSQGGGNVVNGDVNGKCR